MPRREKFCRYARVSPDAFAVRDARFGRIGDDDAQIRGQRGMPDFFMIRK